LQNRLCYQFARVQGSEADEAFLLPRSMDYQEGEDVRDRRDRMACLGNKGQRDLRASRACLGIKDQRVKSVRSDRRANRVRQGLQVLWDRKVFLGSLVSPGRLVHRVPKESWVRRE
jgi:hypothetical protein